jgi:hypothetical protein
MDEFKDTPTIALGTYEHYKGKRYRVLGVGCHTEADDYICCYTKMKANRISRYGRISCLR